MKIVLLIIIAFGLRYGAYSYFGPLIELKNTHSLELLSTSVDLKVNRYFGNEYSYDKWYQRVPLQVLYLHLIQRNIIFTIMLSVLSVVLLWNVNEIAGWLWCFYPQDIIYSFQYGKEALLLFMVISAIYIIHKRGLSRWWILLAVPLIMTGFASYGTNHGVSSSGFINNVMYLWKPSFDISVLYSVWFQLVQAPVYVLILWIFLRNVKIMSPEFFLCIGFSVVFGLIYSEPHYRDPLMPIILVSVIEILIKKYKEHGENEIIEENGVNNCLRDSGSGNDGCLSAV